MTLAAALPDWMPRLSPQMAGAIGFALRQWLTAMLALYICFALQLESPYWALLTVWIVAQPTPGMVLSKSLYLVFGTIAGAIMGVALIAIFTQAPGLFVVALALIVGGCTVASNLLTNFRAYGTVLAGYTAGIVASGSLNAPDQAFFIGMARVTCILTGISCSIVVTMIFAPHRSEALARVKLLAVLKDAAHRAAYSWQANNETRLQIGGKLITDLIALNTLIEFAAAESGAFRLLANRARSLLAHIFGLVSARRSLDAHLARCGWPRHHALEVFHGVILDFLHEMPERLDRGQVDELIAGLDEVWRELKALNPEEETLSGEEIVTERFVIDRLEDLLKCIDGALRDWRDILQGRWEDEPRLVLNFHRDERAAWINGLRAFVAVSAMGAFWIESAWDHGTLALIFVAVLMSLFSTLPHPDKFGLKFLKAGLLATPLALVCKYLIMSAGSGFEYLCLALGLFFVPLALVMSNPTRAPIATGFAFIFVYLIRPDNAMTYNLSDTLNTALGVLTGVLFGALSYMLVFPPSAQAARRYVIFRIRQGLEAMAQSNPIPYFCSWQTRMYDRVTRLNDPQNPSGTPGDEWLDAGLKAVTLGDELLRLRYGLEHGDLPAPAASAVRGTMAAFGHFVSNPGRAVEEVQERLRQLGPLDPGPRQPGRREWAQTMGSLSEINIFLSHFPRS
jgi:uncharacterized membrane protein YccC